MYCIECGTKILENSKFCSNCGYKQIEQLPLNIKKENEIIERKKSQQGNTQEISINYNFLRKSIGWYCAWVLINLAILLIYSDGIFDNGNMGAKYFWPFGRGIYTNWGNLEVSHYDITEFLVYTIFPIVILFIISLIKSDKSILEKED